jgi:hypothetical protein
VRSSSRSGEQIVATSMLPPLDVAWRTKPQNASTAMLPPPVTICAEPRNAVSRTSPCLAAIVTETLSGTVTL